MNKTKIDWCDYVWNPVWGCYRGCRYCYARKFARRFAKNIAQKEAKFWEENEQVRRRYILKVQNPDYRIFHPEQKEIIEDFLESFSLVFLISNFEKLFPKKSSKIFVNSMSDIRYWKRKWMEMVLERIKRNPQHTFLFLTKSPHTYGYYSFPRNCWLGVSFTGSFEEESRLTEFYYIKSVKSENLFFISLEPFLDYELFEGYLLEAEWVIAGAQTNPYRPPKKEWIEDLINLTRKQKIKLFIKDNIYRAYPDLPILKEFPAQR